MTGRKSPENSQWGLASPDGTRASADALLGTLTPGEGTEPIVDLEGRVWVRVAGGIAPPGFPTKVQASAAALTNSEQIQIGSCKLSTISGFNNDGALTYYAQVYDLAAAPGGGDVPVQSIPVVSMAEWSWSPDLWEFVNGIYFALSTTPLSFTAAAVQGFWSAELYTP
jgi:hypothetical protein